MTRQEIMDNYAKEQGYDNWERLILNSFRNETIKHYDKVIDLIQEELKKEIAESDISIECINESGHSELIHVVSISKVLNTPNL